MQLRKARNDFFSRVAHALRERHRVRTFNSAYVTLRALLPTTPPTKKLSKIEILRFAISYVCHLKDLLAYC